MKNLLFIFFIAFSTAAFGQGVKIKWEDQAGREFSITAPSGEFSYGMIAGDNISYDFNGRVNKVGSVYISYDFNGRVNKVGSVYISYDFNGRVNKVGGLYVKYDFNGRVTGTSGSVV
jgi:hypothetical protein